MAQQTINLGTSANDGTGDNLRSAMDKCNDNFTELYGANSVSSNIAMSGNTISTFATNQDIVLGPNGTGTIRTAQDTIPDQNDIRFIGNANIRHRGIYVGSAGLISNGPLGLPDFANTTVRDATITTPADGQLVLTDGNVQVYYSSSWSTISGAVGGMNNVVDDTSPQLGGNLDLNSKNIDGTGSINITGGVTATGNVTGAFLIGNGSQLTDVSASSATTAGTVTTTAQPNITSVGTLTSVSVTGNITVGGLVDGRDVAADGALAASAVQPGDNISDLTNDSNFINLTALSVTTLSASGDGALVYNSGNGVFQFTPADAGASNYGDANVATYLGSNFGSNVIVTTGNITASNLIGEVTGDVTGNITSTGTSTFTTVDINGGAVDGVVIGANSAAAGNFTTIDTTGNATVGGNLTVTGSFIGNISGNVTGTVDADTATVSNLEVDNFKATAIVIESEGIGSNDNDTTLPTSAAVKDYVDTNVFDGAFGSLSGKPTTLAGYGITDAATLNNMAPTGNVDFTGATSIDFNTVTINNLAFADISSKPTTLAGYGITDAANTSAETTFTADVKFDTGTEEAFDTLTGSTGTVTHDCNNGHVFYHTTPAGDITANFTNLGLTAEYATNLTVIINQGATPYEVTAVQIGGAAQTINWQGGSQPTGNANGIDAFSFTILNDAGTYVVLGQMVDFT
jgi:hypothetical protein